MGDSSFLKVTLLSAQGLKDVCTFGKMSPYAKAWIDPSMKQRTPVASNAGCTPVWGHKLSLPLSPNALTDMNLRLFIQVMNQGLATDTIVGSATIPLGDLIRTTIPNEEEFVAVKLERPSGRVQGLINFSVQIVGQSVKDRDPPTSSKSLGLQNPVDMFPEGDVKLPDDTMAKKELSERSFLGGRLSSGKEILSAPDALGSGHSSVLRHDSAWNPQQVVESSSSRNEVALDPLGPTKRSESISLLVTPLTAASKGTAGNVAPDALDLARRQTDSRLLVNATVDSPPSASRDGGTEGNGTATPNYAQAMFGNVLGTILMGDTVSDSKASGEHGGNHGHDNPEPGGNSSGPPQC